MPCGRRTPGCELYSVRSSGPYRKPFSRARLVRQSWLDLTMSLAVATDYKHFKPRCGKISLQMMQTNFD